MFVQEHHNLNKASSMMSYLLTAFKTRLNRFGSRDKHLFLPPDFYSNDNLDLRGAHCHADVPEGASDEMLLRQLPEWVASTQPAAQSLVLFLSPAEACAFSDWTAFFNLAAGFPFPVFVQIGLDLAINTALPSDEAQPASCFDCIDAALSIPELTGRVLYSFRTSPDNCFWADDLRMKLKRTALPYLYFYPSSAFLIPQNGTNDPIKRETFFHNLMFFDNLGRDKALSLAARMQYKRWVKILNAEKPIAVRPIVSGRPGSFAASTPSHVSETFPAGHFLDFFVPSFSDLNGYFSELLKGKLKGITGKGIQFPASSGAPSVALKNDPRSWNHVLITGWYGTETNGDKAIIGEVLHFIKTCAPNCKITLTTIYHPVSIQTNFELADLEGVRLISIYEKDFSTWVSEVDAVIMGGGPMMETSEMINVLRLFEEGNRQRKARIIFGCGIGPFHTQMIEDVTKRVVELCTAGFVRDRESWEFAGRMSPGHVLQFACDPAVAFIYRWKKNYLQKQGKLPAKAHKIAGLLRANTNEFAADKNAAELDKTNRAAAAQIGSFLGPFCQKTGLKAELLHMNAPWVGGDDRLFNRYVEDCFSVDTPVRNERNYLELDEHIERLLKSEAAIAMRYHGHIFSMALGIPFLSIDYTGKKGKVGSLVSRINYSEWSEEWSEINAERASTRLYELYENREALAEKLNQETEKLVALLYGTYETVFNVKLNY